MTINNRKRLQQSGVLTIQRPTRMRASRPFSWSSSSGSGNSEQQQQQQGKTKLVHFQRHGQGYHNLVGDIWRELNMPIDMDSSDPKLNPFLRPEIRDAPLTHLGREQCANRRIEIMQNYKNNNNAINPQLVIVSPLLRAIQTAKITFQQFYRTTTTATSWRKDDEYITIPWIAHEACREELGLLVCNQRRRRSEIVAEHPEIDFQYIEHEEDVLWEEKLISDDGDGAHLRRRRESVVEKTNRIYDFLKFLEARDEDEIVVVGHSSWLFYMLNAGVVECDDDDKDLARWFLTSEVRSICISFWDNPEYSGTKS
jgi:broad specificity phosphatase PhoE